MGSPQTSAPDQLVFWRALYLACVHLLSVVNNAAIKIDIQYLLQYLLSIPDPFLVLINLILVVIENQNKYSLVYDDISWPLIYN